MIDPDDSASMQAEPGIAVVIPCFNAAATLADQLEALIRQTYPMPFEVVVADNRSTDGSAAIARSYQDRLSLRVVSADAVQGGAHALNVGTRAARAPAVVYCDADDIVGDGWLSAMAEALDDHAWVGGRLEWESLNDDRVHGVHEPQIDGVQYWDHLPDWPMLASGNWGMLTELFHQLGGFDDHLVTLYDGELSCRAVAAGHVPVFVPDAVVHVRMRSTLRSLYRQTRRWGQDSVTVHRRFVRHGMPRPSVLRPLAGWAAMVVRLLRVRSASGLASWVYLLGWKVGRLRGSIDNRWFAP